MSSASHEFYLRKFSKKLQAPIFSIDYPLAPSSKYQTIVSIAFWSYLFVLSFL